MKVNNSLAKLITPKTRLIAIIGILILLFFPLFIKSPHILHLLILMNVYSIFASSWDLLFLTGQVSLGQAAFVGIAAYSTAILSVMHGIPVWPSILLSSLIAMAFSLIIGVPSLRLKGAYLALLTLIVPIVMTRFTYIFSDILGGEEGIYGLSPPAESPLSLYYMSLILMLVSVYAMFLISNSTIGLALKTIREDETVASVTGVDTTRYKILVFALSAFFTGFSGAFYAHYFSYVGPYTLTIELSAKIMAFSLVGGGGTIVGGVVGAYLLTAVSEYLRGLVEPLRLLIYSLILVLVLRFMPGGIIKTISEAFRSYKAKHSSRG